MDKRRMCPHCRAFITSSDKTCPYCGETVGPRASERRDVSGVVGGFIPHARFTTSMILLVNFGLYVAMAVYSLGGESQAGFMGLDGRTLVAFGAKYTPLVFAGQWWRLVTAGFLHGGLLHILMNSWVLFDLGAQVEELYGTSRLLVIYFVATVCGFAASTFWSMSVSVGASAGIFGLIGAMIALGMRSNTALGSAIRGMYIRWAIYGLILGLLPGLRIDNAAHIGGLAGGFGIAYLCGIPGAVRSIGERIWTVLSYLCIAATVLSFLAMYLSFSRG